ncbi:MAG: hypothetical protein Sapg2KO_21000 [Saprospiraceae bacterium]
MRRSLLIGLLILFTGQTILSAQTTPNNCGDGTNIIIESGTLEPGACGTDPENSIVKFRASPFYTTYVVIVTDQDLNIIALTRNRKIDFSTLPGGNYRVYGLFYNGRLRAEVGMNAGTDVLAGWCYGLTDNFIEINSIAPAGGLITNAAGLSQVTICTNDPNISQVIDFASTSESPQYQYIITDEQNVIQALPEGNSFDFSTIDLVNSRVYGLAFTESSSLNIGDDLPSAIDLEEDCSSLSDNFLSVTKVNPAGGMINFLDGSTSISVCTSDDSILPVQNSEASNTPYAYILTDDNNSVISFTSESNLDLTGLAPQNYRIYGAAFTGNLQLESESDIFTSALSDGCFDLSENFLSLSLIQQSEGGTVSTSDGQTTITICINDPNANQVIDFTTTSSDQQYQYIITDEESLILAIPTDDSFDFSAINALNSRVYGLASNLPFDLSVGDLLPTQVSLNESCAALSDNFLSIIKENPIGSTIRFADGSSSAFGCDYEENVFSLEIAEPGNTPYVFIITSRNDIIIDFTTNTDIDFNDYIPSRYKIYGAAFTGNLLLESGDDILGTTISDGCFELSDNVLGVGIVNLESDNFSLAGGGFEATLCRDFLEPAVLEFTPNEGSIQSKLYLVTDTSDIVLGISINSTIDFSGYSQTDLRVWCLAYTGNLLLQPGDQLGTKAYSSQCSQISDQFVSVKQEFLDSGPILLDNGATESTICLEADQGKVFRFDLEGLVGGKKAILVTDLGGTIVQQIESDSLVVDSELPLNFRVYGVVYTGELLPNLGNNIVNNNLSDGCFELSISNVAFSTINVEGGNVQLDDGSTSVEVCVMDGREDLLTFDAIGVNAANEYRFVLTNENDEIILALTGNQVDFDVATMGTTKIYGVSYAGNWIAQGGQNIMESQLADLCFDVSDNYIEIIQLEVDAGSISFADGTTTKNLCLDTETPPLSFQASNSTGNNYTYFLTNTNNEIIAGTGIDASFDFDQINLDTIRVWGTAYTGALNIMALGGSKIDELIVSDACYDISENFLTVIKSLPLAGQLTFNDGSIESNFCSQESNRTVTFSATNQNSENYTYLITDQLNVIQAISSENSFDFNNFDLGLYRIWGLAYAGNLTAQIGDFAPEASLSDACFALTAQALTIQIDALDGGTLMLSNGETNYYICEQLDEVVLNLADNQATGDNFIYLVVAPNQEILALSESPQFNLSAINSSEFTLKGLSYNGTLQVQVGDIFTEDLTFSDECYDLSENEIFVGLSLLNGGNLGINDNISGTVEINCSLDNQTVEIIGTPAEDYVYFVSDENDGILLVQENQLIDFTNFPNGNYQIYGAAFSGTLSLQIGQNARTAKVSEGCFERSANTIQVEKNITQGGTLSGSNGSTTLAACTDDNGQATITLLAQNAFGPNFIFLLTNLQGQILQTNTNSTFTIDFGEADSLLVYGLSYAGMLSDLTLGTTTINEELANDCFDLSSNAVTLIRTSPMGGQISLEDQSDRITLCSDDTNTVLFATTGITNVGTYSYLITSEDNEFLSASTESNLDFSSLETGTYHIWGVHSLGDLSIRQGDDITNSNLSSECFDLSDNFITVFKTQPLGGSISTIDGDEIVYACPGQGNPKIIEFETVNTLGTGNIAYLLVDSTDTVIQVLSSPILDLDTLALGNYGVYSVTYNGELLVGPGSTLDSDLASSCSTVSLNKVSLVIETPVGGVISANGVSGDKICINNIETLLRFSVEDGSINTAYTFLISNDRDEFLFAVQDSVDLNVFFDGNLKVWGLAYTGNLTIQPLEDIKTTTLSDDCYELSSNILTIVKEDIDGGTIATAEGASAAYACPGDGSPDIIRLSNTSTSGTANYAYIITTVDNNILRAIDGNERDFDDIGAFRELRVWGVSYTGTLNTPIFAGLFETQLSDACFDISNNFVPIFREAPEAASIGTDIGDQDISLCPGVSPELIGLNNASSSLAGYAYLLVDLSSRQIAQIITDSNLVTRSIPIGNYQLFGLSYTGNITAQVGDEFSDLNEFTDNCHELTTSSININRGGEVDGGMLSTTDGTSIYNICPFNQIGAIIPVVTPEAIAGSAYRLVITDEDNRILFPDVQNNNINFDGAMPGEYRIWGISFTGDYRGQFGLDVLSDILSTECYTASDNFITVIITDTENSQISTADGMDTLTLSGDTNPLIAFQNTTSEAAPYRYLLTDATGTILQITETDQLDFSGLTNGVYQVYGISYTGVFQAEVGDLITDTDLADLCFALSENTITVVITSQTNLVQKANSSLQQKALAIFEVQVYPNPVRDRMMVQFEWQEKETESVLLRVIDQNGRILQQQNIPAQFGKNTYELNLSSLPEGLFMIQLSGADYQGKKRFIKVQ